MRFSGPSGVVWVPDHDYGIPESSRGIQQQFGVVYFDSQLNFFNFRKKIYILVKIYFFNHIFEFIILVL